MFKLYISEVLNKVKEAKDDEGKSKILRDNSSIPLQQLLFANFNPKIKFLLPETPTPYKPSKFDVGLGDNTLMREFKKLYLFYQGGHPSLHQAKREKLWIQLLEGLSSSESKVMESLKNKKFEQDYGVTRECVELAFPKLLVGVEKVVKENTVQQDSCCDAIVTRTFTEAECKALDEVKSEPIVLNEDKVKPKKKRTRKTKTKTEETNESPTGTDVQS